MNPVKFNEPKKARRIRKTKSAIEHNKKLCDDLGIRKKYDGFYSKMNPVNCGDPNCSNCSNPRKVFKTKTIQELKFLEGMKNDPDWR